MFQKLMRLFKGREQNEEVHKLKNWYQGKYSQEELRTKKIMEEAQTLRDHTEQSLVYKFIQMRKEIQDYGIPK